MKTLKAFEFKAFGGAKSSYDWEAILDGKIHQLDAGADFDCKPTTFCTLARSAARKRGLVVQTGMVEGGVVIQSSEASKEQLKKWKEQDEARAAASEDNGEE